MRGIGLEGKSLSHFSRPIWFLTLSRRFILFPFTHCQVSMLKPSGEGDKVSQAASVRFYMTITFHTHSPCHHHFV